MILSEESPKKPLPMLAVELDTAILKENIIREVFQKSVCFQCFQKIFSDNGFPRIMRHIPDLGYGALIYVRLATDVLCALRGDSPTPERRASLRRWRSVQGASPLAPLRGYPLNPARGEQQHTTLKTVLPSPAGRSNYIT